MGKYAETSAQVLVKNLYLNHTSRALEVDENTVESAAEAAIKLIILAGFDEQDSDYFGAEMGDIVQSLLTVVMLRCPQLRDRLIEDAIELSDDFPIDWNTAVVPISDDE